MDSTNSGAGQDSNAIMVRPDRRFARGLMISLLLAACAGSGISIAGRLPSKGLSGLSIPFYLFLIFWLMANSLLILSLLWIIFGAQVAWIRGHDLMVEYRIGTVRLGRSKVFSLDDIRELRIDKRSFRVRGNLAVKHSITFEYLGTRQVLFEHLSGPRAAALLDGSLQILGKSQHNGKTTNRSSDQEW
jgi:hypothetical protein